MTTSFQLGVEYGFMLQFGIFSYILVAVQDRGRKQAIKSTLGRLSAFIQYLSFETLEAMLRKMKILRINTLKTEFVHVSVMHGQKCHDLINEMEVDEVCK